MRLRAAHHTVLADLFPSRFKLRFDQRIHSSCFAHDTESRRKDSLNICLIAAAIITAAVFFVLLFPYASGMNVADAWLDIGKHLARIWY